MESDANLKEKAVCIWTIHLVATLDTAIGTTLQIAFVQAFCAADKPTQPPAIILAFLSADIAA